MKQINKSAQEEMVGFALIIILVVVILLVFLGFSLRDQEKETVESYEAESFIQSSLHYTSDCRDNLEFMTIQKLITNCNNNAVCLDGRKTCNVLKSTLSGIVKESWPTGVDRPVKAYKLTIESSTENLLEINEGSSTLNSKGSSQFLPNDIKIFFTVYF